MTLAKNIIFTFSTRVLILGIGFVSSILIAKNLGPAGNGIFAMIATINGLALQFGNLGLHASNIFFSSKNESLIKKTVANSIYISFVLGFLLVGVILLIVKLWPEIFGNIDKNLIYISSFAIPFILFSLFTQNILIVKNKIKLYNIVDLFLNFLRLAAIVIILYFLRLSLFYLIIVITAISIFSSFQILYYLKDDLTFNFDYKFFKRMLSFGLRAYLANLLIFFVLRIDIFFVNYYKGISDSGIYSIAVSYADILYLLPTIITALSLPTIIRSPDSFKDMKNLLKKTFLILLPIFMIMILVFPFLVKFFYGFQFTDSIEPLYLLALGIFCLSLNSIVSNYIVSIGFPKKYVYICLFVFIINLIGNFTLIPTKGIIGAAISSSMAYAVLFLLTYLSFIWRRNKV